MIQGVDGMRRKAAVIVNVRAWERRRYWLHGTIEDTEIWQGGKLYPFEPPRLPPTTTDVDYCALHRTRIYSDLACQFCGERPLSAMPPLSAGDIGF